MLTTVIKSRFARFLHQGPAMVALTSIILLLGVLALVSPLAESEAPAPREGFLLAIAAAWIGRPTNGELVIDAGRLPPYTDTLSHLTKEIHNARNN